MKDFKGFNQQKKILVLFLLLYNSTIFSMRMALVKGQQKKTQVVGKETYDQQKSFLFFDLPKELQRKIISYLETKDSNSLINTCSTAYFAPYNIKRKNNPKHKYHSLLINIVLTR